jgi:hypothetical protein
MTAGDVAKSLVLLALAASLCAAGETASPTADSVSLDGAPVILSATVDYETNRVSISGSNFSPKGAPPKIEFEQSNLILVSFSNESAAVFLPPGWASGSYLLAITNSDQKTGVYHMELDVVPSIDKLRYHWHGIYGIVPAIGTLGYAGLLQELNAPKEWGSGWSAYGRRLVSTEACGVIHGVLAYGLDSTLRQDPRYFHSDAKGFWRRLAHTGRDTVLTHTDSGGETFSTWRFGSAYGAEFLSNLWYPDRLDTVRLGFLQGSLRMGFDFVTNVYSEFSPDVKKWLHKMK